MSMNKDQVQGTLKDMAGKIQEEAGKLVGSKKQQAKGLKKQAEGKIQKGIERDPLGCVGVRLIEPLLLHQHV